MVYEGVETAELLKALDEATAVVVGAAVVGADVTAASLAAGLPAAVTVTDTVEVTVVVAPAAPLAPTAPEAVTAADEAATLLRPSTTEEPAAGAAAEMPLKLRVIVGTAARAGELTAGAPPKDTNVISGRGTRLR